MSVSRCWDYDSPARQTAPTLGEEPYRPRLEGGTEHEEELN